MSSVSESSLVRKQSGSIEGRDADGWALHTESSGDQPVFQCLFLTSRENGRRMEKIVGESTVEWRFLVESTTDLVIRESSKETREANGAYVFLPGSFDVDISERD